jgi:hypothetical protein
MYTFNQNTKWVDKSQKDGQEPILTITLNLSALRVETKAVSNMDALRTLVSTNEETLLSQIANRLIEIISKNSNSSDLNVKAVIDYILSTDEYSYREYPCGSCLVEGADEDDTCWRLVCEGNHCWCPICFC